MSAGMTAYTCAAIFDGQRHHRNAALVVDGRIVSEIRHESSLPPEVERIDLGDGLIVPGFVDLQVNGGGGFMLNEDPTVETITKISNAHALRGTTSILPTLITDTPANVQAAAEAVKDCIGCGVPGVLGLHLEGPHLSIARKGAHDASLIRVMTETDQENLEDLASSLPTLLVTLAPESVTNAQISVLSDAGAIVSLGHSDCSALVAAGAVQAGASMVTHLFNAMSQLGSREPGLVGAALATEEVSAGLIADGFHVDPVTIGIALRAKNGPGKIFLVSDAMASIGSKIEEFQLNGRKIFRRDGRLTLEDGTLAGADIDLLSSVRYLVRTVGIALDEAIRMATLYPAQVINRSSEIGTLRNGSLADFLLLDRDLNLQKTWRGGALLAES